MPNEPLIYDTDVITGSPAAGAETVVATLTNVNTRRDSDVIHLQGNVNIVPDASALACALAIRRTDLTGTVVGIPAGISLGGAGGLYSPQVRAFPFTHATPGLDAGAAIFTPTPGDILLEAWVQVDVAFDGTTPFADIGTFIGGNAGLFWQVGAPAPLDMTAADLVVPGFGEKVGISGPAATSGIAIQNGIRLLEATGAVAPFPLSVAAALMSLGLVTRFLPVELGADPIKLCVSQTGLAGGAAVAGTVGSGVVYLVTATPNVAGGGGTLNVTEAEINVEDFPGGLAGGTYVLTATMLNAAAPSPVGAVNLSARVD